MMKSAQLLLVLAFAILPVAQAQVTIDTFTTAQGAGEAAIGEALGGVRALAAAFGTPSVASNSFTCLADPGFMIGICSLVYDGTNDGAGSINTVPGLGGVDVSTGATELTLEVTALTAASGSIQIEARSTAGVLCQLSSGSFSSTGTITIPFVPSDNGADCVAVLGDLRGIQFTTATAIPDTGSVSWNMLASTPVELQSFSIE